MRDNSHALLALLVLFCKCFRLDNDGQWVDNSVMYLLTSRIENFALASTILQIFSKVRVDYEHWIISAVSDGVVKILFLNTQFYTFDTTYFSNIFETEGGLLKTKG